MPVVEPRAARRTRYLCRRGLRARFCASSDGAACALRTSSMSRPERSGSRNLDVYEVERGGRARDVGGSTENTLPAGRDLRHGDTAQVLRPDLAMEEAADDLVNAAWGHTRRTLGSGSPVPLANSLTASFAVLPFGPHTTTPPSNAATLATFSARRGGDRERSLGRGFEQQIVDHRLVLIGDVGDWDCVLGTWFS
jgi:hypothetical protein